MGTAIQTFHMQNPACVKPVNKSAGTKKKHEYQLMVKSDNGDSIDEYKIYSDDKHFFFEII